MQNKLEQSKRQYTLNGLMPVNGEGEGEVISTTVPLSFWGGIDPESGMIIDQYHPLSNQRINDKIFVLPGGRGSSAGSGVLLEMIYANCAPSGILLNEKDEIIILGAIIAEKVFAKAIPIVILNDEDYNLALNSSHAKINRDGKVVLRTQKENNDD